MLNGPRRLLALGSLLSALAATEALAQTASCDGVGAWNATAVYTGGQRATHQGALYEAKWWTQNNNPATSSGQWDVWRSLGTCQGGGGGGTCTVPGAPTGLRVTGQTSSSISLEWTPVGATAACPQQFRIFQNGTQASQVAGSTATVANLVPSTTYTFRVTATNAAGTSGQSNPVMGTTGPSGGGGGGGQGGRILGYFAQWGVYARNYHVKNIVTSGSAAKLTHINYAFGNVVNGQCVIGDSYADYDRFYDAGSSVDGVADTWDAGALRGSFNQLRKLKAQFPNIKVLFSFGGWTWSGGFGQAAANPTAFANSCFSVVNDPRWAGVFDGIDIDWEYPNACGLSCNSSGPQAFAQLMSALRQRFGSRLVTAAVPAGITQIGATQYGTAAQYVDWYNVMTYDFFGAWAAQGPTAPHSPLTSYPGIPAADFYSDRAIQLYKGQGVPAGKLLLGVGFYGRGWAGVGGANGGLNQGASGPGPGTYEQGIEDYKVLVGRCPATGTIAGTAVASCGGQWWSYDTPGTIAGKMTYKRNQSLGGVFFWELSGDTAGGALINALHANQ
jgi:chitinase